VEKFTKHSGTCVALDLANIDTDQIIPKQFLKRIERTGYGEFLFWDWRFYADGQERPDFVLNRPERKGASILIAGSNLGCGSSREHAPWSLLDHGFRVVIAPSFADIFYNNSLKTGLLPVRLDEAVVNELIERSAADPSLTLTIDLQTQTVSDGNAISASFDIASFPKHCLIHGLDDIGLTLQNEGSIAKFEALRRSDAPFLGL
jgi:3-isopropylmalate/(R)-2-methylmalate dehydratase small subunit